MPDEYGTESPGHLALSLIHEETFSKWVCISAIAHSRVEIKKPINKLSNCLSTKEISVLIDVKVIFSASFGAERENRKPTTMLCMGLTAAHGKEPWDPLDLEAVTRVLSCSSKVCD